MEITKFFDKKKRDLNSKSNDEKIQRDWESPAWKNLLPMPQIQMFLLNLWSRKTV